jgi:hypothetical protein
VTRALTRERGAVNSRRSRRLPHASFIRADFGEYPGGVTLWQQVALGIGIVLSIYALFVAALYSWRGYQLGVAQTVRPDPDLGALGILRGSARRDG